MDLTAGTTVHLLRGTQYAGAWTLTEVGAPDANGWQAITSSPLPDRPYSGRGWITRAEDAFATEAEARAAGKARRKPRTVRTPQPLYGDFAMLAAFSGIKTDGTGRNAR